MLAKIHTLNFNFHFSGVLIFISYHKVHSNVQNMNLIFALNVFMTKDGSLYQTFYTQHL